MISQACLGDIYKENTRSAKHRNISTDDAIASSQVVQEQSKNELSHEESTHSTWPSRNFPTLLIPRYNHIFCLLVALFLSTTLAFLSAVDAAYNCHKYYYNDEAMSYYDQERFLEYYDADAEDGDAYNNYNETSQYQGCRALFINVILPVCPAVVILCAMAITWTMRNRNQCDQDEDTDPPTYVIMADHDRERLEELRRHVSDQTHYLRSCYALLVSSVLCLILWVFAYILVFAQTDKELTYDDENDDQECSHFQLNFDSLGAINEKSEVGHNANFYYTIWISLGICIALVYEMTRMTFVQHQTSRNLAMEFAVVMRHMENEPTAFEAVRTWSVSQQQKIRLLREIWYDSLHKLRKRTGIWLSTLVSSLVLYSSSNRVWRNSVYPSALATGELHNDGSGTCDIIHGYFSTQTMDDMGFIHPSICQRTKVAKLTGIISVYLSFLALLAHFIMRTLVARETESSSRLLRESQNNEALFQRRKMLIPMRAELLFALLLAAILGINAFFTTAVAGPAPRVGNLYYSTWISFLLSMKLMLGCWEEIVNEDDEQKRSKQDDDIHISARCINLYSGSSKRGPKRDGITKVVMMSENYGVSLSASKDEFSVAAEDIVTVGPITKMSGLQKELFEANFIEEEETSRTKRLRRWGCIVIFALLYSLSILDSAAIMSNGTLDVQQWYMVICPVVVTIISIIMFCLCLGFNSYETFVGGNIGGISSLLVFSLWVCNLILTLHSPSSWAVNEIGEIQLANLYYFTWLCIFNAGLLSSSYVKSYMKKRFNLSIKSKDVATILWLAIIKVCFVMFGSCVDIYLSVKDECKSTDDSVVFCRRTLIGAWFSFTGMVVGSFSTLYRYFVTKPSMFQLRVEVILAGILSTLFAISLGLITGIGGPGQVVGDLYYASWLSFLVSLGATSNIFDEYRKLRAMNACEELYFNSSRESGQVMSRIISYASMKDQEIV